MSNTHVFEDSFAELLADSRVLDSVVAVIATTPNTNRSVEVDVVSTMFLSGSVK